MEKEHPKPFFPQSSWNIAGMKVPRGGSMCKNCRFLTDAQKKTCGEPNFIKWNFGKEEIPGEIDEYCSSWYEPKKNLVQIALGGKKQ